MRLLRLPERPIPEHPYRDSAIVYALMALVGFGFLLLSGQRAWIAAVGMSAFFVAATGWSWFRFRSRLGHRSSSR